MNRKITRHILHFVEGRKREGDRIGIGGMEGWKWGVPARAAWHM